MSYIENAENTLGAYLCIQESVHTTRGLHKDIVSTKGKYSTIIQLYDRLPRKRKKALKKMINNNDPSIEGLLFRATMFLVLKIIAKAIHLASLLVMLIEHMNGIQDYLFIESKAITINIDPKPMKLIALT